MWKTKDYLKQKDATINHFSKNSINSETIAQYCADSGVPIIVVCDFLGEAYPEYLEMCQKKIRDIKQFFGMKE